MNGWKSPEACVAVLVAAVWATASSFMLEAAPPPYPPSPVISNVIFEWSTLRTEATGSDNWPITWADDDHQYTSFGDGGGFGGTNSDSRVSLGVARIEGSASNYKGYNVWGGKNAENRAQFEGKSYGIICIDGVLYMWVSPGSCETNYSEVRLARSTDHGAHWTLSSWKFTKSQNLMVPTILQFGKDYAGARDSYVYHYFIHPSPAPNTGDCLHIQKPGKIYLARVPKDQMMTQSAYQFLSGYDSRGNPIWSDNVSSKIPVFQDPDNGVGWTVSVSYNPGLKRYLLITEHTKTYPGGGNIGIFDAPEPWGPWTTALFQTPWAGVRKKCFFWNFSNKWLSPDGREFVLVFTGRDHWNTVRGRFLLHDLTLSDPPKAPSNLRITKP
ncbi:MAG TPA: DUF4185 domain-containing protein [Acidobacteriota bacterium]|nr:DUF4185 domain-containing protein [Acidobacteriota bacterium]